RDVELIEGQALFAVAHDVARPFIVSAGNAAVRAVGTQFDVYRKQTGTTVTVVEGRVAVSSVSHAVSQKSSQSVTDSSIPHVQIEPRPSPEGRPEEVFV